MADKEVVNEWLLDAYGMVKDQRDKLKRELENLVARHENIVNTLADVCRRSDRMQEAGDRMRDLLDEAVTFPPNSLSVKEMQDFKSHIDVAIQDWGNANV